MPRYKVNHDYSHRQFNLKAGDVVSLGFSEAEALTAQAGSVITRVADDTPLTNPVPLEEAAVPEIDPASRTDEHTAAAVPARALDEAPNDRMQRAARTRDARQKDKASDPESGSAGPMTDKPFGGKAV